MLEIPTPCNSSFLMKECVWETLRRNKTGLYQDGRIVVLYAGIANALDEAIGAIQEAQRAIVRAEKEL